jgi:hypothetical protein
MGGIVIVVRVPIDAPTIAPVVLIARRAVWVRRRSDDSLSRGVRNTADHSAGQPRAGLLL